MPKGYDDKPLLVAVGSPEDAQSSIWRLWVQKDDVYFGTIDTLPAFKFSLHKSGRWRAAFVRSLEESRDRAAKKWMRPREIFPGFTDAVIVAISSIPPRHRFGAHRITDARVKWIHPPPRNRFITLLIRIASKGTDTDPTRFVDARLLGRLKKTNGETVCLIASERPLTGEIAGAFQEIMIKLKIHVDQEIVDKKEGILRSRVVKLNADDIIGPRNPPTVLDVEIGWDSVLATQHSKI